MYERKTISMKKACLFMERRNQEKFLSISDMVLGGNGVYKIYNAKRG